MPSVKKSGSLDPSRPHRSVTGILHPISYTIYCLWFKFYEKVFELKVGGYFPSMKGHSHVADNLSKYFAEIQHEVAKISFPSII